MVKVSICIPTYNTARYLPTAINSVLEQRYQDYELVICDDGSTDETPEICRRYDDSRVRYIRTPGKSGQSGNFNRCLNEARGELVTLLHADDYFLPGFLEDRVGRLERSPQYDFVFGAVQVVDANGELLTPCSGRWPEDREFRSGELLEPMLHGCILCPPSLMIRTSCLAKVGHFRTDLTWGPDWEWDLRLAEQCGGCFTGKAIAAYRVHDGSGTAEQLNAAKNGAQERRILQETFRRLCAADGRYRKLKKPAFQALSRRHMYFAGEALVADRRSASRSNLWYALRADWTMAMRPTFYALLLGSMGPRAFILGILTCVRGVRNLARFRVSVVIPTHNRPERLADTIAALARQDIAVSDYEIIVVDDGSKPSAVLPVGPSLPRRSLVRLEGVERSAARNAGATAAQGELLVFMDDDILVPCHFLAAHLDAHAKWPDAILVGDIRLPPADDPFTSFRQRLEEDGVPRQSGLTSTPNFCAAGNMAIPRSLFLDLGGFDPGLSSGEDQDLALRHTERGGRIAFVLEASVLHRDNALNIRDYCRRTEWGYDAMIPFCRRHPNLPANKERQRVNGAFSLKQDGLIGGLRKAIKGIVSLPPVPSLLLASCRLGERVVPHSRLLEKLYRLTLGVHIFRGYRRGLGKSIRTVSSQRPVPIDSSMDVRKEDQVVQA